MGIVFTFQGQCGALIIFLIDRVRCDNCFQNVDLCIRHTIYGLRIYALKIYIFWQTGK